MSSEFALEFLGPFQGSMSSFDLPLKKKKLKPKDSNANPVPNGPNTAPPKAVENTRDLVDNACRLWRFASVRPFVSGQIRHRPVKMSVFEKTL